MANSGLPSALCGQIYHAIDYQPCVEAVRFDLAKQVPLNYRAGFAGSIGISVGQAPILIRLTFAVTAAKSQFNFLARMAQQLSGGTGFSYDFWEGNVGISSHWLITGCFVGEFGLQNDPMAGTSDKTISVMGQDYTQLQ